MLRGPLLIVFGGLPGTGKSSVSQALARSFAATYLRIDAIEQTLKAAGVGDVGASGYAIANALAEANLKLGGVIIADCVNPVAASRQGWRDAAARTSSPLMEIEIVCSEPLEHRRRVESRSPEIAGHVLPIWEEVIAHPFEPWTGDHLVLDTAMISVDDAAQRAETYIIGRSLRVAR
jgi:predicted kinase